MTTLKAQKIIFVSATLTFIIGFVNSAHKNKSLPSRRFVVGSGIVYLGLTALAEVEPDVAAPVALAVLTTSLLGEGGGVLDKMTPKKELDTSGKDRPALAEVERHPVSEHDTSQLARVMVTPAEAFKYPYGWPLVIAGVPSHN